MFNISNNLKRSWQILWNYKVLWIFAFLLALTSGNSSNGGSGGNGIRYTFNGNNNRSMPQGQWQDWMNQAQTWITQNVDPLFATRTAALNTAIWIVVGVILLIIVVSLLFALVRYPAESAIIRMVDEHERTGQKLRFSEGWKLGWTRRAFRLWVIDLILSIPVILFVIIMLGGVFLTVFGVASNHAQAIFPGVVFIIFAILFSLVFIALMVFLGLLRQFFARAALLEDTGVGESFSRGWQVFKQNAKNAFLMWLILLGIGFALGIGMVLVAFLLIPTYVIMAIPGAIVAAVPAAIAYGISSLFVSQVVTWIIAGVVAIPFLFAIVFSPLIFIGGLVQLFNSNNWTLSYRQFITPEVPPALPQTPPVLPVQPAE